MARARLRREDFLIGTDVCGSAKSVADPSGFLHQVNEILAGHYTVNYTDGIASSVYGHGSNEPMILAPKSKLAVLKSLGLNAMKG